MEQCCDYIRQYSEGSTKESLRYDVPVLRIKQELPEPHYLSQILADYLNPSLQNLQQGLEQGSNGLTRTACAWILFFTGLLYLYVPDRPFDPALKPLVERTHYYKRRAELQIKLEALKKFEIHFSGQTSSFRTDLVKEKILALGTEPPIPSIARPQVSELGRLQGEFNNIISSIMQQSPNMTTLRSLFQGNISKLQEIRTLRSNINQAIFRLSLAYRAYDDMTKPLVSMLLGLDVGLAAASLAATPTSSTCETIQNICESTPFLGMRATYFSKITFERMQSRQLQPVDPRLHFLDAMALRQSVDQTPEHGVIQVMHQVFLSLYQSWEERLKYDQQQNAKKSSMYRYRGSENDDDEADENEFHAIFPMFNEESEKINGSSNNSSDPHMQALNLARLQRNIFNHTDSTAEQMLNMIANVSRNISKLWTSESTAATCSVPAESLMCGVILSIASGRDRLNSSSRSDNMYNFYVDTNLVEVQRLVLVMEAIQSRFLELANAWPEHATIKDVLQASTELLALRHVEPLAKLLTKAEQVHNYVNEWQMVASKEYSAINLYNQLTTLLVDWRRLELSTWARLMDIEDKKCSEDADSWWFLAYEVIIAVPLSMIGSGEELQSHVEQLFTTLGDFITTTSIGQYAERLRMIEHFKSYIELLAEEEPTMTTVQNSLINFLSFYTRFETVIGDYLQQGRSKLQKDMKEILLLASWKDTNINALRESAKRSHHKLFKIIRKYRALLAEPADKLISRGIPKRLDIFEPSSKSSTTPSVSVVNLQAVETNQKHLPDWNLKPARFTNPLGTARNMSRMVQLPLETLDSLRYLESYADDLIENSKVLQRETPSKTTKDNSEQIKHLKSRKKKLFASSLKDLQRMGFRSNLSADVLAQQQCTAGVLAKIPAFLPKSNETAFAMAEFHFHKLLHIMPQVREKYHTNSGDLSHRELTRCVGYLESMLSTVLQIRAQSVETRENLEHLNQTIESLQNVCSPQAYTVHIENRKFQKNAERIKNVISWLPGIIEAGCIIVKKYAELGELDSTVVIEALAGWTNTTIAFVAQYKRLPCLPIHLSSSLHQETYEEAKLLLANLKADLERLSKDNQNVSFVLRQILLWTEEEAAPEMFTSKEPSISILEFDQTISKTLDFILVAVQRVHEKLAMLPISVEENGWLTKGDTILIDCLRVLNPRGIDSLLDTTISKIHFVEAPEGNTPDAVRALCAMALPIAQQYSTSLTAFLHRSVNSYRLLCNLATISAQSFCQIAAQGFCNPAEDSTTEAGKSENLEGGTGLGEGEGAEDISKDVKDDEDLSELAQAAKNDKDKSEIEHEQDAVSMDQEELEGSIGDASEREEDVESGSEDGENDVDEEAGDVHDSDPSAIDEKLWDGGEDNMDRDREGYQAAGKKKKNEQVAADADQKAGSDSSIAEEDENSSVDELEEGEKTAHEDPEKLDPHLHEGQNLELPEEMDLDNGDQSSVSSLSDSDMNNMSENEQEDTGDQNQNHLDNDLEEDESTEENAAKANKDQIALEDNKEVENDAEQTQIAGSPVDTQPDENEKDTDESLLQNYSNEANADMGEDHLSDTHGFGTDNHQQAQAQENKENHAQGKQGGQGHSADLEDTQAADEERRLAQMAPTTANTRHEEVQSIERSSSKAFKKLGDALEKWHRQQRQIQATQDPQDSADQPMEAIESLESAEQEFEHLDNEDAKANTQALGAATDDQVHALNEQAFESQVQDHFPNHLPDESVGKTEMNEDTPMKNLEDNIMRDENQAEQSKLGALMIENSRAHEFADYSSERVEDEEIDINHLDSNLLTIHLQPPPSIPHSASEALRLWTNYSTLMHPLSLTLTEQLRLILAPTLATKMRGDFRTGKRLNIKRIIPYIASSYKRDKIWMRRSVPSKRAYQILLAVDDSKSMSESSGGHLAFETLALVAKSLSMLEVGEICVVSFGAEVHVAHEFEKTFSVDAGAEIFRHFTFQQEKTDVRKLVEQSITLFQEARNKSTRAGAGDLWQLELIISDGVCEDHEAIRRLVRRAQEERIVIVFVIVDAGEGKSILDMSQAVFEPDDAGADTGSSSSEGTKLRIKRYLDGFPFAYYLVVGDVKELPGVLATALRQWFAEVVESG